jgi:S-formylglutathione hydrolase FrmB
MEQGDGTKAFRGADMMRIGWIAALALALSSWTTAHAQLLPRPFQLEIISHQLAGRVVDYTHDNGSDNRFWSAALGERRDMYIYLPPGYDPCKQYPFILWLHGFAQDEHSFLMDGVVPLDKAIRDGRLPPAIVAAPDGSLRGVTGLLSAGSFWINTPCGGPYEDYLMQDVWDFVMTHYSIRPEPEAHAVVGVSMGGGGAFHTAIKHPDRFKTAVGFIPPLNNRWEDCHGHYMANFDPNCWGWRTDFSRGREVLGRFYLFFTIRQNSVGFPLYGRKNPYMAALVARDNPIEMLDAYDVQDGEINMYVAYAGLDEFNLDAQAESFLYHARERGICVDVDYHPWGHHTRRTLRTMIPRALDWLGTKLAPYAPEN